MEYVVLARNGDFHFNKTIFVYNTSMSAQEVLELVKSRLAAEYPDLVQYFHIQVCDAHVEGYADHTIAECGKYITGYVASEYQFTAITKSSEVK